MSPSPTARRRKSRSCASASRSASLRRSAPPEPQRRHFEHALHRNAVLGWKQVRLQPGPEPAVQVHAGRWTGDQGLGPGPDRHVQGREAPPGDPGSPRLRRERLAAKDPRQLGPRIRSRTAGH
uniref:Uncharacterized protein n=1 Tax=Macrostomum lignano TaxID=282301 RepID=A0A1I8IEF8_9PLAT